MITAADIAEIKAALLAEKFKPDRRFDEWEYRRGWNDGLEFSVMRIEKLVQK